MFDKHKICCLRDLGKSIAEMERSMEETFGLNLHESLLLCQLHEQAGLTAGEVGQILGLPQPSSSKVIRSLERKGFLRRSLDKTDKRVMHYQLTKAGQEKLLTMDCGRITFPPMIEAALRQL